MSMSLSSQLIASYNIFFYGRDTRCKGCDNIKCPVVSFLNSNQSITKFQEEVSGDLKQGNTGKVLLNRDEKDLKSRLTHLVQMTVGTRFSPPNFRQW